MRGNNTQKSNVFGKYSQNLVDPTYSVNDCIKWSRELINTSPEFFHLSNEEDDCGALVITNSGVYEISFTFFVPPDIHKPTIQMRLNGKPVLSTIDS